MQIEPLFFLFEDDNDYPCMHILWVYVCLCVYELVLVVVACVRVRVRVRVRVLKESFVTESSESGVL